MDVREHRRSHCDQCSYRALSLQWSGRIPAGSSRRWHPLRLEAQGSMTRYFVNGGAGFIGSHFLHALLEQDSNANVVNLDLLTYAGNPDNISDLLSNSRYRFRSEERR